MVDEGVQLLCAGDFHLGRHPTRIPDRLDGPEFSPRTVWQDIVRVAIDRGVDAVVLTGDIADRENRYFEAYGAFEAGAIELEDAGIPVVMIAGNHDSEFPELEMDEPTGVAGGNSWERFNLSEFPSDIGLVHKMGHGVVDLTFGGRVAEETAFRNQYEPRLGPDMNIVTTGKSLSVRLAVSPLDWKGDPTEQSETIHEGLSAASRLLEWYRHTEHASS